MGSLEIILFLVKGSNDLRMEKLELLVSVGELDMSKLCPFEIIGK